jgi:hypothetical protein
LNFSYRRVVRISHAVAVRRSERGEFFGIVKKRKPRFFKRGLRSGLVISPPADLAADEA